MTKKRKLKSPSQVNLLEYLQRLEAQIPLTPEEQEELLPPPEEMAAGLRRTMALVEAEEARLAEQHLELARKARDAVKRKVDEALTHRPRAESLALVAQMRARPDFAGVTAFHRNFESLSDADLDVLVADLQFLQGLK